MATVQGVHPPLEATGWDTLTLASTAVQPTEDVLGHLGSTAAGLSREQATARLAAVGANALRSHGARPLAVLARQLRNPLLILLVAAALTSFAVGEHTSALIILLIIGMSVGLGFFNEYRSELAVEALHSKLRHTALVMRDGEPVAVDVTELVPGDVVRLAVGDVVPADLRLLHADGLECDEAVLTGESLPAEKRSDPVTAPESSLDLASCAFMGTVVRDGSGLGVVVCTGARTEFGAIAMQLGERQPQTAFQLGLRDFSLLLVRVTAVLAGSILVINVALGRSLLGSVLFALAIAVGLTPQLLPAIVTISLSTGAKRLAERSVVVKRLVSIEDLGNIVVLFTDKTGTLTEGAITFAAALDAGGHPSDAVLRAGLLCNDATFSNGRVIGGNQLDQALWQAADAHNAGADHARRLADLPFDYQRRLASVLVEGADGERQIIVKGAPETVLARCSNVPPQAQAVLDAQFAAGSRVIAVATRVGDDRTTLSADDERDLDLAGFLTFVDRPKADAHEALEQLKRLDVAGEDHHRRQRPRRAEGLHRHRPGRGRDAHRCPARSTRRRAARSRAAKDDDLRARYPGAEVAGHQGRACPGLDGRIPRRRRQRRGRPPRRGRRYLRADSDRCGQGRRRHRAARQGPRDPRGRRRRGPAHLRQHDQVHPDGHLVELREHVQHGRRLADPELPADAPDADPAQQPALRHQRDDDPHRQRRRGAAPASSALGHRFHPPLHDPLRPDQLDLRLRHLRDHDLGLQRPRAAVPIRLVRRVARNPEPGHLRHPHPPHPVLPEQAQHAPRS